MERTRYDAPETENMDTPSDEMIGSHFGRYRITDVIGEGGMARVYRAVLEGPLGFSKSVAIKRIRVEKEDGNERLMRALVNEARLGGKLSHPNVVDVLEFDESEGSFYIVMEYVDGLTLGEVLARCRRRGVTIPIKFTVQILADVARGLSYAHGLSDDEGSSVGLIHRDLKPGNILVSRSGQAMVADFGLAKSDSNLFQSSTVEVKGTPAYMSPEQVTCKDLTPAADLFSLGSILYEMLRSEPLFVGDNLLQIAHQVARAPMKEQHAWVAEHVPFVADLFLRLMEKDPDQRPQSARVVEREFTDVLRGFPAETTLADFMEWLDDEDASAEGLPAGDSYAPPTPSGSLPSHDVETVAYKPSTQSLSVPPASSGFDVPRQRARWPFFLVPGLILIAVVLGWGMGWYQRADEFERQQRRLERIAEREQARAERAEKRAERAERAEQEGREAVVRHEGADGAGAGDTTAAPGDGAGPAESPTVAPTAILVPAEPRPAGPSTADNATAQDGVQAPLSIDCRPWCDHIYVDDQDWGGNPVLGRSTTTGTHQVVFHAARGDEATMTVEVSEGGTKLCWDFDAGGACKNR